MKFTSILCAPLLALACTAIAPGQTRTDDASRIAPFVNNFTLGVIRVEPAGIDFDALQRWGDDVIKRSKLNADDARTTAEGFDQATQQARKWTGQFTKAGGKAIWVVVTVESFPDDPFFVVVPLEKGSDGPALQKLLGTGQPQNVVQSRGALIVGTNAKAAERARSIMAQPRPELAKALAEAGDAKLRIAIIPSDDARRVIESMVPKLPNGTSSEALTKGMLWAAVTVTPPANVTVHGIIQSESNPAAEAFRNLLGDFTPPAGQEQDRNSGTSLLRALGEIAAHAQVKGDRLTIDLNENQTEAAATHLTYLAWRARTQANRMASATHIRQLLIGMQMYANEHKGEFPDTLEQAAKRAEVPPAVLINPGRPAENPGYVYIKPPDGVKAGSDRVVLYEKYKPTDEGINLGFADGHVEFWPRQTAEKQIEAAKARAK